MDKNRLDKDWNGNDVKWIGADQTGCELEQMRPEVNGIDEIRHGNDERRLDMKWKRQEQKREQMEWSRNDTK